MSFYLSIYQIKKLREFWQNIGGLDRLTDDFVNELNHYMRTTSTLITDSNKRIETEESRRYKKVADACNKLLDALNDIPDIDRLNVLSLREIRPEYDGRSLPICNPLDYVKTIRETAEGYSYELKKCVKYERQWKGLRNYIKRFPSCRDITKSQFSNLFSILYDVDKEALRKAKKKFKESDPEKVA